MVSEGNQDKGEEKGFDMVERMNLKMEDEREREMGKEDRK